MTLMGYGQVRAALEAQGHSLPIGFDAKTLWCTHCRVAVALYRTGERWTLTLEGERPCPRGPRYKVI